MDDRRGVGEPLNETQCDDTDRRSDRACDGLIVRGRHHVLLGPSGARANRRRRRLQALVNDPPLVMFGKDGATGAGQRSLPLRRRVPLARGTVGSAAGSIDPARAGHSAASISRDLLPKNVHLLSLYRPDDAKDSLIVRLAHLFGPGEGGRKAGGAASVDLCAVLPPSLAIRSVEERSLSTSMPVEEASRRLVFRAEETPMGAGQERGPVAAPPPLHAKFETKPAACCDDCKGKEGLVVDLQPMQVRP